MTWNIDPNAILIAVIAIVPGLLAYTNSRKTRKSVQLAGSDVTVNNFNKLIQSLYAHISFLESNEKRFREKIKVMETDEELYRTQVEIEKKAFVAQIDSLTIELQSLQQQINEAQKTIAKQQKELVLSNNAVKRLTKELARFKETYQDLYAKKYVEAVRSGKIK